MAVRRSAAGPEPQQYPTSGPAAGMASSRSRLPLLGFLSGALLAALVVVGVVVWLQRSSGGDTRSAVPVPAGWDRPVVSETGLAERSGVKLTRVAMTGGGGLVDLRYQVVDPDKADALHDLRTPPALVDERTGLLVNQLFMDHSHHGALKAGVTYYLVFNNPGNWVRRGSMVTVLLGDAEVQHVVVR